MKINLHKYDKIVINSSAGKDSLAMLHHLVQLADDQHISRSQLVVVHADLGKAEWKGTRELAEKQAKLYGLDFRAISREQDLLDQIRYRGMWPSNKARYCTSDHKRGQIAKVLTQLVREADLKRPVKILNCLGLRAQESSARAKKNVFERNKVATGAGKKKIVDTWHPILDWSEQEVWATIKENNLPYHPAYDLGMPRLSCVFCVFAPKAALIIAGRNNPELLDEYCQIEEDIQHDFRHGFKIAEVREAIAQGETADTVPSWTM